jgi:DNA repair exonuclease SbcCD ATPase subunit
VVGGVAKPENTITCQEHSGVETGINRILEILENQDQRLKDGDQRFEEIKEYMTRKNVINGYTAKDIEEWKKNKKSLEERVTNLEKNTATKEELENIEDKLPSKFLIYINTTILVLFILAVILEAARDAPVMKFLGL